MPWLTEDQLTTRLEKYFEHSSSEWKIVSKAKANHANLGERRFLTDFVVNKIQNGKPVKQYHVEAKGDSEGGGKVMTRRLITEAIGQILLLDVPLTQRNKLAIAVPIHWRNEVSSLIPGSSRSAMRLVGRGIQHYAESAAKKKNPTASKPGVDQAYFYVFYVNPNGPVKDCVTCLPYSKAKLGGRNRGE